MEAVLKGGPLVDTFFIGTVLKQLPIANLQEVKFLVGTTYMLAGPGETLLSESSQPYLIPH